MTEIKYRPTRDCVAVIYVDPKGKTFMREFGRELAEARPDVVMKLAAAYFARMRAIA